MLPSKNLQVLSVFKVMEDDTMELCGYYTDMLGVDNYFKQVQKEIDESFQHSFEGDYLVIPTLYYKMQRTVK